MNAEQLYEGMKEALKIFRLRFSDMDKVRVQFGVDYVTFSHGKDSITFGVDK